MPDVTRRYRILVIDDIPDFQREMRRLLTDAGMHVTSCLSPREAIELVRKKSFDLVITTLVMREMGGFDVIRALRGGGSAVPIMMITGYGSESAAAEATRLGAQDFMNKPVMPDELLARVRRILSADSRLPVASVADAPELITCEPAMRAVLQLARAVASADSRVLITGETGTGKQLVARLIHHSSPRSAEPFIDVNCAAIPDTLLESELFGHEKGAFTGADSSRMGRFEEAGNGTLFLDEIGEMSYAVQSKLLKVLQDGRFSRVGGSKVLQSRARVLAATNRDLEKEVREGRFRADLYYRLQVVTIYVPPLRLRKQDIPLLAEHFLRRFDRRTTTPRRFGAAALTAMQNYEWPGNVRELENLVERVALLTKTPTIGLDALPERLVTQNRTFAGATASPYAGPYRDARAAFERDYVRAMMAMAGGNLAQAARLAGIDRAQFFRLAQRQGMTGQKAHSASVSAALR